VKADTEPSDWNLSSARRVLWGQVFSFLNGQLCPGERSGLFIHPDARSLDRQCFFVEFEVDPGIVRERLVASSVRVSIKAIQGTEELQMSSSQGRFPK